MKRKKSQVTIFIILGLVILFTAMLMFIVTKNVKFKIETQENIPVRNFVQDCLKLVGDKGVEWTLIQGGTYEPKGYLVNPQIYKLAKYVEPGQGIQRNPPYEFSKDNINVGIKTFFSDLFFTCIDNFDDFNITIEHNNTATIDVIVRNKNIIMELNFPITIKEGDFETTFSKIVYNKRIDIATMLDVVNQIVDESIKLNDVPTDLMEDIIPKNNIDLKLSVLYEGNFSENILYFLEFEDDNTVGFDITYDWLSSRDTEANLDTVAQYAAAARTAANNIDPNKAASAAANAKVAAAAAERNYADAAEAQSAAATAYAIRARASADRAKAAAEAAEASVEEARVYLEAAKSAERIS